MRRKSFTEINRFLFSKGFTLTELLTVVVILSILAALVTGTFRQSVERARFQEGRQVVDAIAAAIDRYYYDNPDITPANRLRPKMSQLDVSFVRWQKCDPDDEYCRETEKFKVEIESDASYVVKVTASRGNKYSVMAIPSVVARYHRPSDLAAGVKRIIARGTACLGSVCKVVGYTENCGEGATDYMCQP